MGVEDNLLFLIFNLVYLSRLNITGVNTVKNGVGSSFFIAINYFIRGPPSLFKRNIERR